MPKYYLRIITDSCAQMAENELNQFLYSLPGTAELHTEPIKPYWQNPEHGELLCNFTNALPSEEIQAILADRWESDVADSQWSRIHVPHTTFIWLTAEHESNL